MKKIDDKVRLAYCRHVYDLSREFDRLIQVDQINLIWCHLLVSLHICFSQFYYLTVHCFAFKPHQVRQIL
jgi:hypothetical protein